MIRLRTASGLRTVKAIRLRTDSGLHNVAHVCLRTADGLKTVFGSDGSSSLALNPTSAQGYIAKKGSGQVYTNSLTVSGFSGTPTILWEVPTGWSVVNQGSATTAFRSPSLGMGEDISTEGGVTVTPGGSLTFDLYASNEGV